MANTEITSESLGIEVVDDGDNGAEETVESVATHNRWRTHELIGIPTKIIFTAPLDDSDAGQYVVASVLVGNSSEDGEPSAVTVAGNDYTNLVERDVVLRFYGQFVNHAVHGWQFSFTAVVRHVPADQKGIVRYLADMCGDIGPKRAEAMWNHFGADAVRVLREEPNLVIARSILPSVVAITAAKTLGDKARFEATQIELGGMFESRGFPRALIKACIDKWDVRAAEIVRRDPFRLMTSKLPGCGFNRCDRLWIELGHSPGAMKRQVLAGVHTIGESRMGDTWHDAKVIEEGIRERVNNEGVVVDAGRAIVIGSRAPAKYFTIRHSPGGYSWIALARHAKNEAVVAGAVSRLLARGKGRTRAAARKPGGGVSRMSTELNFRADLDAAVTRRDHSDWLATRGIFADWLTDQGRDDEAERLRLETAFPLEPSSDWPDVSGSAFEHLSNHQHEQLQRALVRPLAILTGSPGTGKTFAASALVVELCRQHAISRIAICCPTGKAAVRFRESLDLYRDKMRINVPVPEPKTIHSTLKIGRNGHDGEGWGFEHTGSNPLPYQFVIADEMSMAGTDLAASLLSACASSAHVLLIGDLGQLPPVGHGAPLRDMIAAGVPCGTLREIHRNAGAIVKACAAIRDNEEFEVCQSYDRATGKNLLHIEQRFPNDIVKTLITLLESMGQEGGAFKPSVDVQVICALNDKTDLSRKKLNLVLRDVLNGKSVAERGAPYRVNDRVICLRNGMYRAVDCVGETEYVANGEIGYVAASTPKVTRIQFGRSMIEISRVDYEHFDLAYAITAHKGQGSEYPLVIVPIDPGSTRVAGREWWYTAISRASQLCITIGRREVMAFQARQPRLANRQTFLRELIEGGMRHAL